jgi:mannose-1-phosphate guanylyltransferase/mannose-6-phosphate isomerase
VKVIILAGGKGTRLYPLSTPEYPKQFLKLFNDMPMLIATIKRFNNVMHKDIIIITNDNYNNITQKMLEEYELNEVSVITEPQAKNTAPAIALGIKYGKEILGCTDNEVFIVAPSDHMIYPAEKFTSAIENCCEAARQGFVATIGVKPDCADTGYGYIKAFGEGIIKKADKFVEKPCKEKAREYFEQGGYYWNSGIYVFTAATYESELKLHQEDLFDIYAKNNYQQFIKCFDDLNAVSIDYAISERSNNIVMISTDMAWSDIGNWDNLYKYSKKDQNGNVIIGEVKQQGCKNCLLIAKDSELIVVDLTNMIIISDGKNNICIPAGFSQSIKDDLYRK